MKTIRLDTADANIDYTNDLLSLLCDQITSYVYIKDLNRHYIYMNEITRMLYGLPEGTKTLDNDRTVFNGPELEEIRETDDIVLNEGLVVEKFEEIKCRTTNEMCHYRAMKIPIMNKHEQIIGILGIATNVTDLVEKEREMARLADTDPLTGIANRRLFINQAEKELSRAKRHGGDLSLIIADVDHFKMINDTYGHQAGDDILKNVSKILEDSVRLEDTVARIGGEEFAILLPNTDVIGAYVVAEKIRTSIEELATRCKKKNCIMNCTISMGLANFNADKTKDIDDLFAQADQALYKAKRNGRNCVITAQTNQKPIDKTIQDTQIEDVISIW